jgi:hypothetical protein
MFHPWWTIIKISVIKSTQITNVKEMNDMNFKPALDGAQGQETPHIGK